MLGEMRRTTVEGDDAPDFRYGLGIERVRNACGVNWGPTGVCGRPVTQ